MEIAQGFVLGDRILQSTDSHADLCAAFGEALPFRIFGASAIGKLHVRDQRPRDDAFAVRCAGDWLAVAVSDGVGSRKLSRYGACFCVEVLCEQLLRRVRDLAYTAPNQADYPDTTTQNQVSVAAAMPKEDVPTSKAEAQHSLRDVLATVKSHFKIAGKPATPLDLDARTAPRYQALVDTFTDEEEETIDVISPSAELTFGTLQGSFGRRDSDAHAIEDEATVSAAMIFTAFRQTHQSLEIYLQSCGLSMNDASCTLLGLLLNTATGAVAVGHIGDGLIAMTHPAMGTCPVVEPPAPEEAGTVHAFTRNNWEQYLAVKTMDAKEAQGVTGYYLMSDGVAEDCTHAPPENILKLWASDINRELRRDQPPAQTSVRLARWLATYDAPASWDDRTLVAILRW